MKKGIVSFILGFAVVFAAVTVAHAQDTTPPTIPTGVSASVTQSGQVYISWNPSTDNIAIEGYYVYRDGQLVANTPGLLFFTDNAPAGTHTYTVTAYDAAGNISQQSLPSPLVTIIADTQPPTAPTGLTLAPSSSSIALSWGASTDNVAVIGYYIYRNYVKELLSNTLTGTTYTDTGLSPGVSYTYQVGAYDAAGNVTRSPAITATTIFDVTPPTPPTNLKAKVISPNEIDLSWSPATDNISVSGYEIYQDNTLVTSVDSSTFTYADTSLSPNTSYSYQVAAVDEVGNASNESSPADASTMPADLTPPSIPSGIAGVALSASEINLSWMPSTDNVGVAGY